MKKIFLNIIFLVLCTSCTSGIKKILAAGYVNQNHYVKTFPFEYSETGHIVLKVAIKGKEYDFILDTGATNIVSEELASEIGVKVIGNSEIRDINDKASNLDFLILDEMVIGGVSFKETITSVMDINKGDMACLGVDGIIGSNLMRHAVWDFDFENKKITITSDENLLETPVNYSDSKIFVGDAYQVSLITEFNGKRVLNSLVDLGNAGAPMLSYKYFKKLKDNQKLDVVIKGEGGSGFGAFGRSVKKRVSFRSKMQSIKIGTDELKDVIVISKDNRTNLGLSVFKNHRVIINWKKRSFKMMKRKERKSESLKTFAFLPVFDNNKLYVDYLYTNSDAAKLLKYRDQILEVNGKDYSVISLSEWCNIVNNGLIQGDDVTLKVLRDGEELVIDLKKESLL